MSWLLDAEYIRWFCQHERINAPQIAFYHAGLGPFLMNTLEANCRALDLISGQKQIRKIRRRYRTEIEQGGSVPGGEIGPMLAELRARILEDLEETVLFQVEPPTVRRFFERRGPEDDSDDAEVDFTYRTPVQLFGPDVLKNFGSTAREIDEAARCLVWSRDTGAVFHLMRVMEVGLRALGKSLNDPNLDPIINVKAAAQIHDLCMRLRLIRAQA